MAVTVSIRHICKFYELIWLSIQIGRISGYFWHAVSGRTYFVLFEESSSTPIWTTGELSSWGQWFVVRRPAPGPATVAISVLQAL
jgi:hypothetical protein